MQMRITEATVTHADFCYNGFATKIDVCIILKPLFQSSQKLVRSSPRVLASN